MTTDRPTAPRPVALNRPAAAPHGRQPDAPADAFSALLGAAGPRTDDAPRSEPRGRRDDGPRPDRRDDVKAKPASDDQPKAVDAPKDEPIAEEPTEPKPRLVTPDIFALQLASPLPTTPALPTTPVTGVPAEGESQVAQPTLPTFTQANLALTGQTTIVDPAAAAQGEPVTTPPAPAAPPTPAAGTPGGIPLPLLTGLTPASQADVSAIELPATPPAPAPADAATAAPQPDATVALPNAGEQTSSDPGQQQNPQSSSQNAATTLQAKPTDGPPAPTTAQPLTPTAPVVQVAPTSQPVATERAVPLYRAPETAAAMIKIAADRGITHAKLSLRPAELGGIEVRLKTTPQGVTALLVADSAEAAKLLTQTADDLRRDLADRNVNLLSLDVSTQQQYQEQQQAGQAQADIFGDDYLPGGAQRLRVGLQGDEGLAETAASADTTLVLPNGVLVDVLA
ncbi:flagellar hook-length control protein FliK [Solirubrobacter phytolaccae]|uniref:Flagellar hook-length control protein FliK n=1 Tax=Solirubrobacter phytolaccae TaxID=1404360 RepID=A0A9X3NCC6_9ACTN|nr:flagellar hook-length control protein FliK [Solirubrobacter phytolaccae]MDA0183853.1 flagellar hook-length control protein FliK [Solirubrobacter phytolaccae]